MGCHRWSLRNVPFVVRALWLCASYLLVFNGLYAQITVEDTALSIRPTRCIRQTALGLGGGTLGSMILLDRAWYAGYDRSSLHAFNDGAEWLQMDKAGHAFSAYTLGAWGHRLLGRCGGGDDRSLWIGGSVGLMFLTGVELLDGTSQAWGFSWWDMVANVTGTGMYIAQAHYWKEQRVVLKLSARPTSYAARRPELLGEGLAERVLKDYNGQTVWISGNLSSFIGKGPKWLNLAMGMGAEGMVTAEEVPGDGRYRQFYLSPDVDLTRIPTRSRVVRTLLFVLNGIKFPAPAIEVTNTGRVMGHWVYF
jgi:uncharacterized protein YfiM (DUF2279 family)